MRKLILFFFINLGIVSCSTNKKINTKTERNLKDYAFCSCLIEGYKRDSIDLKDISISVLYELTDYNINLFYRKQIDSLTTLIVNDIRPLQVGDYGNKKAVIFNCLQYYKGEKLRHLIHTMKKIRI